MSIDKKILKKIINDYKKGIGSTILSKKFNIPSTTIMYNIKKHGLIIRKKSSYRKNYLNEFFFDNIDSELKAWSLGFIMADGSVYNKNGNYTLDIQLNKRDIDILNKINDGLESTYKISISKKRKNIVRLLISSKIIFNSLKKYGVVENKTFKTCIPILDNNLYRHFIRGVFDGDGSINSYYRNNRKTFQFNVVGYRPFLNNLNNIISNECNIKKMPLNNVSGLYGKSKIGIISCGSHKSIKKIRDFFYNDSSFYSIRKYNKFFELI